MNMILLSRLRLQRNAKTGHPESLTGIVGGIGLRLMLFPCDATGSEWSAYLVSHSKTGMDEPAPQHHKFAEAMEGILPSLGPFQAEKGQADTPGSAESASCAISSCAREHTLHDVETEGKNR